LNWVSQLFCYLFIYFLSFWSIFLFRSFLSTRCAVAFCRCDFCSICFLFYFVQGLIIYTKVFVSWTHSMLQIPEIHATEHRQNVDTRVRSR
jgi:hypothetical protein